MTKPSSQPSSTSDKKVLASLDELNRINEFLSNLKSLKIGDEINVEFADGVKIILKKITQEKDNTDDEEENNDAHKER